MSDLLILWSARLVLVGVVACGFWVLGARRDPVESRGFCVLWSATLLMLLFHVACAYQFRHDWSHAAAYADTARRSEELLGQPVGSGIYWNDALVLWWSADVVWMWAAPAGYRRRPRWWSWSLAAFLAFMLFNAAIVFATGPARWMGVASCVALVGYWLMRRRRTAPA
ncbi:MAG TPA: hypothetical protein VHA37_00710 [Candidatus Saccharimonadales bacterium]|nr:hypothetical protein [Candidatus Saccharimonadales bacterium]